MEVLSSNDKWHPGLDARSRLLPGASAWSVASQQVWGSYVGGGLLLVLLVGMLIRGSGYWGSPILMTVVALLLIDAIFFIPGVLIRLSVRKRREVRAGYTTVTNQYPEVDQIDPKTGRIVRLAGEETLNRDEYLSRIGLIREAIESEQPGPTGGGTELPSNGGPSGRL